MSEKGQIDIDPHGGESASVSGPLDEHMADSQPTMGHEERSLTQVEGSSVTSAVSEAPRSKSPVPKGRRSPPGAAPSKIPTRTSVMKRRSPTPPRSRITLEGEAAQTLQRTQDTAQSAAGQADAALQAARTAMLETAAVRKTVEDALAAHLQTSTSLSGQQIASLAHETSKEFQAALGEQRRLEQCLKEQREETAKLQQSLQQLHASRVTDAQAMEQNRAVAQATTSGRIDDLQASIQQ